MLLILIGTTGKMGYDSRKYMEEKGFQPVSKVSYTEGSGILQSRFGKRDSKQTADEVLKCDYVYRNADNIIGFNKKQIIDAVTGRQDCYVTMSPDTVDFVEKLKLAHGDYVVTVFVYTDQYHLTQMTEAMSGMTEEEKEMRLSVGERNRRLFLEKRSVFDEIVIYGGEDSVCDTKALFTQYDHIIRKGLRRQRQLNDENFVEMPYTGPDNYIFVSYSHKDKKQLDPILAMLQRNGCRIWYDEGINPGADWSNVLAEKIEKCAQFFLISSENSAESTEVQFEIDIARHCGKKIVTIRLDDATFPLLYEVRITKGHIVYYSSEEFEKILLKGVDPSVRLEKRKEEKL